jgi:hypothetical protein
VPVKFDAALNSYVYEMNTETGRQVQRAACLPIHLFALNKKAHWALRGLTWVETHVCYKKRVSTRLSYQPPVETGGVNPLNSR